METILKGIEQGGAIGLVIVFAGLWYLEVRERWRRERESIIFRSRMVRAQVKTVRILTKIYVAMSQDDAELDGLVELDGDDGGDREADRA